MPLAETILLSTILIFSHKKKRKQNYIEFHFLSFVKNISKFDFPNIIYS
ncbi:hypothetical protein Q787_00280 [Ornithobacterium rhinotracheale H06-030791]|nr:hypothetical protein Q785_00280 [Ornithobacterium rhinotracheale ORT-UMN 88]KGB67949.1 hypothetical protein Q787_00280 [Ornithobacterium rhinotracheale H06-030791]